MAKSDREFKEIYRVSLKERTVEGYRIEIERYDYQSAAGALKKYEDLIGDNISKQDKKLLVELQFIYEGKFSTLRERHLWEDKEYESNYNNENKD